MLGIVLILLIVALLGVAFLGIERSSRARLLRRGPWLVGAVACVVATLIIVTYDAELHSLLDLAQPKRLQDLMVTAAVMTLLAGEAVLVSRCAITTVRRPVGVSYLAVFTSTTLLAWLITALVAWAVVPGS